MAAKNENCEENLIQITKFDNPHKFWYKYCNAYESDTQLVSLERRIAEYVEQTIEFEDGEPDLEAGDVIAFFHTDWKRWIRCVVGNSLENDPASIRSWLIDYGFKMTLRKNEVVPLRNMSLAYHQAINVHLGGLSDIVPAKLEFDYDSMDTEIVELSGWSADAKGKFVEWIDNQQKLVFKPKITRNGRSFGELFVHDEQFEEAYSVALRLCANKMAIESAGYMDYVNGVEILNRNDFLRLNHEMSRRRPEIMYNETAENILMNDDILSIDMEMDSASVNATENCQPDSITYAYSALNGNTLSTTSMTLSLKSLNKLNVCALADDSIIPTFEWKDTFYFSENVVDVLKLMYKDKIDPLCSYGWPHTMRGNSLLTIGNHTRTTMMCIPTICTIVWGAICEWRLSKRIEPIAIIFVNDRKQVKIIVQQCRAFLNQSNQNELQVFGLFSSLEVDLLMQEANDIDILVANVFCFRALVDKMPKLFTSKRFRFVWFDKIDEMCDTNSPETHQIVDHLLSHAPNLQVIMTAEKFCPMIFDNISRVEIPMVLIEVQAALEAALFARCRFYTELVELDDKIKDLVYKLKHPDSNLTGSIVIMCATAAETKIVTGHLTQENIRCTDFDTLFSSNQMKLVQWTERSQTLDCRSSRNILVCDDESLSKYPIRTAAHIIHYSLPNKVQTFVNRYMVCFGYYAEKLDRELLRNDELNRPISLIYIDENFSEEFVQIYDLLVKRANCEFPIFLQKTIEQIKGISEEGKENRPICKKMIIWGKDCDLECPYRHKLTDNNDTFVPNYGFVNMQLIDVLAPNHYTVRVLSHKRRLIHKSKPVDNFDEEFKQFDDTLCEFYAVEDNIRKPSQIVVGALYLVFSSIMPKRCRVVSKSKKSIRIYLIDDGKARRCNEKELFYLDEEFHTFPALAIEMFVLGILPSDSATDWLPEATPAVEHVMAPLKDVTRNDIYLQAEVIRTFDRTLIVKDLNILFKKQTGLELKGVAHHLIKYQLAHKVESIALHEAFTKPTACLYAMSEMSTSDNEAVGYEDEMNKKNEEITANLNISKSSSARSSISFDEFPNKKFRISKGFGEEEMDACGSRHDMVDEKERNDMVHEKEPNDMVHDLVHFEETNRLQTTSSNVRNSPIRSFPSLDEILGSLPDEIQSLEVLTPIQCSRSNITDTTPQTPHIDEEPMLIDLSDDTGSDNLTIPSPFSHIHVISSIDDF